jgi:hypothetical protein
MKATDLRIGNLFYYRVVDQLDPKKEWFEVSKIDYDDLRVIGIKDEMNQDYQPIPLTEEWLLKFGFDVKEPVLISSWKFSPFCDTIITKCEYVHQLQNLYFALIGTELIVKDLK